MIGDSWDTDIEGAMNFGIDQVMFTNNGTYPLPGEVNRKKNGSVLNFLELKQDNRTYFISNLTELNTIL
jgi:putative hydrolase of the HAD superfamily